MRDVVILFHFTFKEMESQRSKHILVDTYVVNSGGWTQIQVCLPSESVLKG